MPLIIPFKLRLSSVLTLLGLLPALGAPAVETAQDDFTARDPVEFTVRGGLPNFFRKLEAGQTVVIAYLGGSITAQAGWRVQSQAWFQAEYPQARLEGVHAAIGGTGSELGVFRMQADALDHQPDLLFVEFAVNDAKEDPENIMKAMEGIVRKTWAQFPRTDICFVYTVTSRDSQQLAAGKMKQSTCVMETVADYYDIPSAHMGLKVAQMEAAGTLVMSGSAPMTQVSGDELNEAASLATDEQGRIVFSKDGTHPYPQTGHVLYTEALVRAMEQMRDKTADAPHPLPAPMRGDNWEAANQFPIPESYLSGPYQNLTAEGDSLANEYAKRVQPLYRLEPGAQMHFRFKGAKAAIFDVIGPDGGLVEVTVDGQSHEVKRIDGYCAYRRLSLMDVCDNLEDGVHEVTIRVLDKPFDKASILYTRGSQDIKEHPEKYAPRLWYPGAILIVGELLP